MQVLRAKNAGACYGVQRALDLAYGAASEGRIATTLGPLIHNPRVVSELAEHGVGEAKRVSDIESGVVIIRSHGVVPQVKAQIAERDLPMIDATCPHVMRAQKAAAKLAGKHGAVLIAGEAGHPEVEGLREYAKLSGGAVYVADKPEDIPEQLLDPFGVVVQTTQTRAALDSILAELDKRGLHPDLINTICDATTERQEAASELAKSCDAIVVVGGLNSSNTTRLADICKLYCSRTYHIESEHDLDAAWFAGCATVGVTAGASTPEAHIDAVVSALEAL